MRAEPGGAARPHADAQLAVDDSDQTLEVSAARLGADRGWPPTATTTSGEPARLILSKAPT
jgi:hypothetical protein